MYLFRVSPLSSGIPLDYLSYFSKEEISIGTLVIITIKKKKVSGLVISCHKVEDEKMSIKNAPYALKKINQSEMTPFISEKMLSAILSYSELSLTFVPLLLTQLIPERLLTKDHCFLNTSSREKKQETLLLSLPRADRYARYKSLIRESFAKRESIILFFPTITELKQAEAELSKGIEDFSLSLHSKLTQKEIKRIDTKMKEEHSLLILSTPSLSPFERIDIGLLIIENELSHHYRNTYGIDFRELFYHIAEKTTLQILFASTLLSLPRYLLSETQQATELTPLYLRSSDYFELISMNDTKKHSSPYLSFETLRELEQMKERGSGHYFIYTQRKGTYPTTVCADCSTLLTCRDCEKPLVLHFIGQSKAYMCHYCETVTTITEDKPLHCVYCGGWRMRTLGIASSGIETLLTHSGLKVFVIDGERTRTKKQVEEVYKNWQKEPLALLIGTELALNMLTECDGITIASLDSLFSLPEYTVDERIVSIIVDCRQKTKGPVYLQTRMRKNPLFSHITDYSFLKYYTWALEERKSLHLPPFYTIIKGTFLTISELEKEKITAFLTKQKLEHVWFEAGGQKLLLFIHIENSIWATHEEIRNELVQLCAHATLEVNPESFFS